MDVDDGVISLLHSSREDLDFHASMVVVDKNTAIINYTSRRADVIIFTPEHESLSKVPIVDAAIRYD